ncbi:hypothetical protein PIROE2DRAFT_19060 [Piromyces sp. E2]|nr:hypothetical protein PIROE2DRAFT_19060 [Piromyces sp. E2]|eukprot:OUM56358.1 hypothetical protein PIROE2DRAFT_19060 [Piromyces sp. E2]
MDNSYNDKNKDTSCAKKEEKKYLDGEKNHKDNNSVKDLGGQEHLKHNQKSYAVKEISSMEYASLVTFEKLDGKKCNEPVQVVYDSGSHVNIIHPNLAKKIGLKVREEPTMYVTVAGKTTLPYVTEEFKLKLLLLMNRQDGKPKWYEFRTTCRLADGITDSLLLGAKFTDKYLIYRGFDERDWKTKVYKIQRPGESNHEIRDHILSAYRVVEVNKGLPEKGGKIYYIREVYDNPTESVGKILKNRKYEKLDNPTENIKEAVKNSKSEKWYNPKEIDKLCYPYISSAGAYLSIEEVSR